MKNPYCAIENRQWMAIRQSNEFGKIRFQKRLTYWITHPQNAQSPQHIGNVRSRLLYYQTSQNDSYNQILININQINYKQLYISSYVPYSQCVGTCPQWFNSQQVNILLSASPLHQVVPVKQSDRTVFEAISLTFQIYLLQNNLNFLQTVFSS
ncbi:Hypothetical_protein [Hexamita inflata]|uniref:Hypothetical_protein n=1 Tax=Hexamita inflata TaxID=28002 RepID=A0AA86PHU8_9EUKA|nr:Hypothetical protein HINF_LOCUS26321 [Hexamita inflata]